MRFDDLLDTVLAMRGEGSGVAITRWRQCIDLLAQRTGTASEDAPEHPESLRVEQLLADLQRIGRDVPLSQKVASVVELGSRIRSLVLVRFLSGDHPAVVTATMSRARLNDAAWVSLIPTLGPLARSVLRRRQDLGVEARNALDAFGSTDMALEYMAVAANESEQSLAGSEAGGEHDQQVSDERENSPAGGWVPGGADIVPIFETANETVPAARGIEQDMASLDADVDAPSEISRIVDRIEAFRSQRALGPDVPEADDAKTDQFTTVRFQFETDEKGTIQSVAGAPRGAAIGLSIGVAALDGISGSDGHGLGAFRRRAMLQDARFVIGVGALSGEWRISAEPRFSSDSGRFQGYSGAARRALAHEISVRSSGAEAGWGALSAATARQLVHELRTPLNAIQGFAEIIEQQMFGPVPNDYRDMAGKILRDAQRLLATFDDLDLASRLLRGDSTSKASLHPVDDLIVRAVGPFCNDAQDAVAIDLRMEDSLPLISVDTMLAERLFMHLFRTLSAMRTEGEVLLANVSYHAENRMIEMEIPVPERLRDWHEEQLYRESAQVVDEVVDGPPLGSAFSFRLVRTLAEKCGGTFQIGEGRCLLSLPTCAENDKDDGGCMREA